MSDAYFWAYVILFSVAFVSTTLFVIARRTLKPQGGIKEQKPAPGRP